MIIYIGADHQGFKMKEQLREYLKEKGYGVIDVGNDHYDEDDDYADFAAEVGKRVSHDYENSKGVVICGSGVGVSVVANKYKNVRAGFALTPDQAFDARNDDDTNVLALAAKYTDPTAAKKILITWLQTPFSGEERHRRRLQKLYEVETEIIESYKREAEM
jgi:ribose 5-phosphate isomerase B